MDQEFEWDIRERAENLDKYAVDFEAVKQIFRSFRIEVETTRVEHRERRWITVGEFNGQVFAIVFTKRNGRIRLISARKASNGERQHYRQAQRDL